MDMWDQTLDARLTITYTGRKLEDSVLWCFAFFLLLGFSSPVSFDDQSLIICSNSS